MRSGASKAAALAVAAVVVAAAALYAVYVHMPGRPLALTSGTVGPSNSSYAAAVRELEGILASARTYAGGINLTPIRNATPEGVFADLRVVNETVMLICGRPYRYAILQLYDARTGFLFAPSQVEAGGFVARLLSNLTATTVDNTTYEIAYIGGTPYTYLITYGNETRRFTFYYIPLYPVDAVYSLGGGVYAIQVFAVPPKGGEVSYAWLVVAPAG